MMYCCCHRRRASRFESQNFARRRRRHWRSRMRASRRPRALSLSRRRVEDARVVAGFSSRVPNEATTMREEEEVERRVAFCAQNRASFERTIDS